MTDLLKRAVFAVVGMVVMLGWWTIRGGGPSGHSSQDRIPSKVFEGGTPVLVEGECSHPGIMRVTFESMDPSRKDKLLETWEKVAPGHHQWHVEVPAKVSGSIELCIDEPPVGSKARVALVSSGRPAGEDAQKLDTPLTAGYAFCAQLEVDDFSAGQLER